MQLSRCIEWIMTLKRPGGPLISAEGAQILVPMFPPNYTLAMSAGPIGTDYAQILFQAKFGNQIVANSFEGSIVMSGQNLINGVFNAAAMCVEYCGFYWVTWGDPVYLKVTNISGIYQEFEFAYAYLRIPSEAEYQTIIDWILHISTTHELENLVESLPKR